jgi:hypothetical protein
MTLSYKVFIAISLAAFKASLRLSPRRCSHRSPAYRAMTIACRCASFLSITDDRHIRFGLFAGAVDVLTDSGPKMGHRGLGSI